MTKNIKHMNDLDEKIIDRDYIGTVVENNGYLQYQEIPIVHNTILINKLMEMSNDSNSSVTDMQNEFEKTFPAERFRNSTYSYLYPYSYYDKYCDNCIYPDSSERTEKKKQYLSLLINREQSNENFVKYCENIIRDEYDEDCVNLFRESYMEQIQMKKINSEEDFLLFNS